MGPKTHRILRACYPRGLGTLTVEHSNVLQVLVRVLS